MSQNVGMGCEGHCRGLLGPTLSGKQAWFPLRERVEPAGFTPAGGRGMTPSPAINKSAVDGPGSGAAAEKKGDGILIIEGAFPSAGGWSPRGAGLGGGDEGKAGGRRGAPFISAQTPKTDAPLGAPPAAGVRNIQCMTGEAACPTRKHHRDSHSRGRLCHIEKRDVKPLGCLKSLPHPEAGRCAWCGAPRPDRA